MKLKQILSAITIVAVVGTVLAAGIHYLATRDPVAIKVDPKLYDDYAGYYDFRNGYVIHAQREGERLMSYAPERLPREWFPETETRFFVKGERVRVTFHRSETGQVDYALFQWGKEQERAERQSELPPTPVFTNGIVAATTAGVATQAGLDILKEGGSAADAAMATALCEVTHAGGSYVSFAGLMMLTYFDTASGKVYFLDAQFQVPLAETNASSIPKTGGRTALVPGFMAGVQAAHDRFGKLPFARLFEPAIALAEKGESVGPVMEWWINSKKSVLSRLELVDLKSSGPYTTSPRSLLWLMQIAECHKLTWQSKPSGHDLSPKSRATKETAAWIWSQMRSGEWAWLPKGCGRTWRIIRMEIRTRHANHRTRGANENKRWRGFSSYEPSQRGKLRLLRLNNPTACPSRAAVPVNQAWLWSSSLSPRSSLSVRACVKTRETF